MSDDRDSTNLSHQASYKREREIKPQKQQRPQSSQEYELRPTQTSNPYAVKPGSTSNKYVIKPEQVNPYMTTARPSNSHAVKRDSSNRMSQEMSVDYTYNKPGEYTMHNDILVLHLI